MKRLFSIAEELKDLDVKSSRLSWVKYTTGYDFGIMDVQREIQDRLVDDQSWNTIQDLMTSELSPVDERRVRIMEMTFRPYHLSGKLNELLLKMSKKTNELSSVLNTHRCRVDGTEMTSPEITSILMSEPDRDLRKKAFLSRAQVNAPLVDAGFVELLDMRKEFAEEYGAEDFVNCQLEQQELDSTMFDSWKDEINAVVPLIDTVRSDIGREIVGDSHVMPWDESYISGRIAPQLNHHVSMTGYYEPVSQLFGKLGIDITEMNITYDIFPRKNKSEWGYNFPVETGVDSRILANVRDRYFQFGVILHETGHAVHSFLLDPKETILNMGVSGIVSEGIANLFGAFRNREVFYSGFFKDEMENAQNSFRRLRLWNIANKLRSVARILFDHSLYRNSISGIEDIHNLVWLSRKSILGEEPYSDEPVWAHTIHYTTHPIYLHNYLLGDLTSDMLEQVFLAKAGISNIMEKPLDFGRFVLDEVIDVSGRYPFPDLFRRISGEDISLDFLIRSFRNGAEGL